jgi:hypothetical protein
MHVSANDLLKRYVAVWNEPDPETRRAEVARLWAADGLHFTQTRRFQGTEALFARVTEAYDQFVGGQGLRFVSADNLVGHHDAVAFNWLMSPGDSDTVLAVGFDVVTLDGEGRITADYQFNEPPVPNADLDGQAGRHLALAALTDAEQRRKEVADLYLPQARLIDENGVHEGLDAIAAAIGAQQAEAAGRGLTPALRGNASAQHDAFRFPWQLVPAGGGQPAATGLDFLVRDGQGLVRSHYRFTGAGQTVA